MRSKKVIKKLRKEIENIEDPFIRDIKTSALNDLGYGLTLEIFYDTIPEDIRTYLEKKAYHEMGQLLKDFDLNDISKIVGMVVSRRSSFVKEKRTKIQEIIEDYKIGKKQKELEKKFIKARKSGNRKKIDKVVGELEEHMSYQYKIYVEQMENKVD